MQTSLRGNHLEVAAPPCLASRFAGRKEVYEIIPARNRCVWEAFEGPFPPICHHQGPRSLILGGNLLPADLWLGTLYHRSYSETGFGYAEEPTIWSAPSESVGLP